MKFVFFKRMETTKDSIFYSVIHYKNELLAFGRRSFFERVIKKITLNETFDIIEDKNITFRGEDPRCFEYNEQLYIQDNYLNDMFLINYEDETYKKLEISGKNITFINHRDELYFIHFLKPFSLCTFNMATSQITKVEVNDDQNTYNWEYRGGTPGYKINENEYYGFGHRTYNDYGTLRHDIFKWIVHFENNTLPSITIIAVDQPIHSKNICDPTSVVEVNNKKYLITAETNKGWFCDQDYITNVYEIIE